MYSSAVSAFPPGRGETHLVHFHLDRGGPELGRGLVRPALELGLVGADVPLLGDPALRGTAISRVSGEAGERSDAQQEEQEQVSEPARGGFPAKEQKNPSASTDT
jgi:hypothetical protein